MTASLVLAATRVGLSIVLDSFAFIVWNIGTRSPPALLRDIRAGMLHAPVFAAGLLRFAAGALALVAAAAVSAPLAASSFDATVLVCWALVVALVIEQLIGPDLRALRR